MQGGRERMQRLSDLQVPFQHARVSGVSSLLPDGVFISAPLFSKSRVVST